MNVKVVFHIDELSKWELVLSNTKRLADLVDMETSRVEVVANSEAVEGYVNKEASPYSQPMAQLSQKGISFVACNGALNGFDIQLEQVMPFVRVVPSGVLELAEQQANGYAYIKP